MRSEGILPGIMYGSDNEPNLVEMNLHQVEQILNQEKKSLIESNEKLTNDMSDMAEKHAFERLAIVEKHTVDMKSLKDELQQNAIATATSDASKFESERINLFCFLHGPRVLMRNQFVWILLKILYFV